MLKNWKMHFLSVTLLILFITLALGSATTPRTENINQWLIFTIPPSRINYTGEVIMRSTPRADGARLLVFFEPALTDDAYFYYEILLRDFGWWRQEGGRWIGDSWSREVERGVMYVNPARRVALYFFPGRDTEFQIFRVRIVR